MRRRDPEIGVREIGLAHIEHEPPHSHAAADMLVDRINSAPWHLCPQVIEDLLQGSCAGTQYGQAAQRWTPAGFAAA
jgi:hypothetical protein